MSYTEALPWWMTPKQWAVVYSQTTIKRIHRLYH